MPGPFIRALGGIKSAAARVNADLFEGIATQDAAVAMSSHLKTLAVSLMKISNDLRWMNSGPPADPVCCRSPAVSAFQPSVCGFIHGPRVEDLFVHA
jgi:fumarate hydratase class II